MHTSDNLLSFELDAEVGEGAAGDGDLDRELGAVEDDEEGREAGGDE